MPWSYLQTWVCKPVGQAFGGQHLCMSTQQLQQDDTWGNCIMCFNLEPTTCGCLLVLRHVQVQRLAPCGCRVVCPCHSCTPCDTCRQRCPTMLLWQLMLA
jgi:hypothetical protein